MQVAELFALTRWIDAEIKEVGIADLYERLRAVLHSNAQPNNQQQPFETQKDELLSALAAVPLHALTLDQLTYLGCVGIAQHVGRSGGRQD